MPLISKTAPCPDEFCGLWNMAKIGPKGKAEHIG